MVLIVEDDPIIVEALTLSLTQEGYEILSAGTKEQALALLRGAPAGRDFLLPAGRDAPRRQRPGPMR